MKCRIYFFILILFISTKCSENKESKRMKLIKKLVAYIKEKDTFQLYNLVDTAYFNNRYGEDDFMETIKFINNNFNECGMINFDSLKLRL